MWSAEAGSLLDPRPPRAARLRVLLRRRPRHRTAEDPAPALRAWARTAASHNSQPVAGRRSKPRVSPGARSALSEEPSDTTSAADSHLTKNKCSAQGIYTDRGFRPRPQRRQNPEAVSLQEGSCWPSVSVGQRTWGWKSSLLRPGLCICKAVNRHMRTRKGLSKEEVEFVWVPGPRAARPGPVGGPRSQGPPWLHRLCGCCSGLRAPKT